ADAGRCALHSFPTRRSSDLLWQVRGDPDTALSWAQVAGHTSGGSLIADVSFIQERPTFPFGTHVSVVEVDTETGQTKMLRHVTRSEEHTSELQSLRHLVCRL